MTDMPRRVALVTLWLAFALASVGVGFAAAGLMGGPFVDLGATKVETQSSGAPEATSAPGPSGSGSAAGTPKATRPSSRRHASSAAPVTTSRSSGAAGGGSAPTRSSSPRPRATDSPRATAPSSSTRGITTRAGYVSATCRGDRVSLEASPTVGWRVEEIDHEGHVKFRTTSGAQDELEVEADCEQGRPVFRTHSGDDGGDSSGGDSHEGGGEAD
jgi:hypothetical protein